MEQVSTNMLKAGNFTAKGTFTTETDELQLVHVQSTVNIIVVKKDRYYNYGIYLDLSCLPFK